jgi:phosphoribosyl 1,2-cyclic phosphodiesterase
MVRLTILGSGSSGNCAVISTERTTLLLDAGLSAKQICLRLDACGFSLDMLDGILLTHEHQDHTGGIEVLSRKKSGSAVLHRPDPGNSRWAACNSAPHPPGGS